MPWPVFLLPVITACANAIYMVVAKKFFRTYGRLSSSEYNWVIFAWLIIVMLFIFPLLGRWPDWSQIQIVFWPLVGLVVTATAANLLFAWTMEHEHLSEVQPFLLFGPLITILIASIFYADQRVWQVYVAAAIASLVLIWSHLKKAHFTWNKPLATVSLYLILTALEVVFLRPLLEVFSPLGIYLIRCVLVLIGLTLIQPPQLEKVKFRHLPYFFLLAGLAVLSTWASYTAFQLLGISQTMLILMLSPVMIYILSLIFLKERWRAKNVIASAVIIGLVLWVSLYS